MSRGRLLIVEDDPRLGPIMADVLGRSWHVVLCTSAEAADERLRSTVVDAMIVDRRLPGRDGVAFITALRRSRVSTPILMLTAHDEVADRVSGLDAGANDYLAKPFEFIELEARLRALTRDYSGRGGALPIGSWTFYPDDASIDSPYAGRIMLTSTETALLGVLARSPERTFPRDLLLSTVFERGTEPGTVDTYVSYLRRKTDRDLVTTVRGEGYRLGTPA